MQLNVNGQVVEVDADPDMPLLWALRDMLGMRGTKYGCGKGLCGACTVHFEGAAVRSCQLRIADAARGKIITIEGLSTDGSHPVQLAWLDHHVPQCGYCQSGMIMAVSSLLATNPNPSDADIDSSITNVCRCGSYPRVRKAIRSLATA